MRLFVGDDWAEDHHDVEVMNEAGKVLAKRRLPEGVAGMAGLHELIGGAPGRGRRGRGGGDRDRDRPRPVGGRAGRGRIHGATRSTRCRHRGTGSGTACPGPRATRGDAHMLTDMVRTDSHQLRAVAGDSAEAGGVRVLARTHKTLIWERTRQVQRLRYQLREYFPAALDAFEDLGAADALELLGKAPDPARAARLSLSEISDTLARLTRAQVSAALKCARRRDIPGKTTAILAALRSDQLDQPPALTAAYAATVRALIAVITTLNDQVKALQGQVEADFGRHPDAEIYRSQPGLGPILGARVLGEFGDDPHRYISGKARKNYAATSPITRASGTRASPATSWPGHPARGRHPAP